MTVTSLVSSDALDEVAAVCSRVLSTGTAFGFTFPQAIRTGKCTESCAAAWRPFSAEVRAAEKPDCPVYNGISGSIETQMALVDSRCSNPVPDVAEVVEVASAAARSLSAAASLLALALAVLLAT